MDEMMNCKIGLVLLLACCSSAKAQDALPHARTNAQPPASQAARPLAPSATSSRELSNASNRHPITPRRESSQADPAKALAGKSYSPWRMLGALLLAIGGIIGVAKLLKSLGMSPLGSTKPLPGTVCEVLGVTQLPQRHTLYLLRLGRRILLLGSTGENLTILSEMTDPEEVASIVHLSQPTGEESQAPSLFNRLLNQWSSSKPAENSSAPNESNARRELEAKLNAFAQS
jgi:flagellar biogenesis protein FliO